MDTHVSQHLSVCVHEQLVASTLDGLNEMHSTWLTHWIVNVSSFCVCVALGSVNGRSS